MGDRIDEIMDEVRKLPPEDGQRLLVLLHEHLAPPEDGVDAAWDAELRTRVKLLERGELELVDGASALEGAIKKFGG